MSTEAKESSIEDSPANMTIQSNVDKQPESSPTSNAIYNQSDKQAELVASESMKATKPNNDNNGSTSNNNETSTSSTAFTISFDDEAAPELKKKFSVRDSIRKFAPPKQFTKPPSRRERDLAQQESSLMSIESLPGNLSNHQSGDRFKRDTSSKFSRSNQHRSSLSRPATNLSESAAFLIDRMLNPLAKKQNDTIDQSQALAKRPEQRNVKSPANGITTKDQRQPVLPNDTNCNEVDFWEDKSDNGTYIVGADPESDAARAKINELFGVVKAAEASIIEESLANNNYNRDERDRQQRNSRQTDKRQLPRERQEHINRLAYKNTSRSSSATRQDQAEPSVGKHRSSSRHSRESSCDGGMASVKNVRPHRSASQTSRNSGHREQSDADTKSSKSSLQNLDYESNHQAGPPRDIIPISNHPNMKFNRAFALRRARLGLAEPVRSIPQTYDQQQPESLITMSPRRQQQLQSSPKQPPPSTSTRGFCRDDGGRYSLRMRNSILPSRVASASTHRSPQHAYAHRPAHSAMAANQLSELVESSPVNYSTVNTASRYDRFLARTQEQLYARRHQDSSASSMIQHEYDSTDAQIQPNSSGITNDYDRHGAIADTLRASSGMGSRLDDNGVQLGALDSLVISAISNISLNIRHSICEVLVEQSRKLPEDNETRLTVEDILPQLEADSKSSAIVEEIDQSLYYELARTLKNLKKVEQMVAVINQISHQLQLPLKSTPSSPPVLSPTTNNTLTNTTSSNSSPNSSLKSKSTETALDVEVSQKNSVDIN